MSISKNFFKKILSLLLALMVITPSLTNFNVSAVENEKYAYTFFGRNGIVINASNLCMNGNIHTNKELEINANNRNINGDLTTGNDISKRIKHVYADSKIQMNYFSENCYFHEDEYIRSDMNININNPVFSYNNISLNGNVALNSNLGALMNINITGEVKNANNSVVYSKYGNITIENNSTTNINGLIYAPLGTLTINSSNVSINGIIIADKITINGNSVNINSNNNIAKFIGTTSETYDFSGLEYLPEEWLGDTDSDELFDIYEKVIDTDPLNPDTDADELPDGYEVLTLSTDPLEVDTDFNGIWDKDEDFDTDNLNNLGEYQNKTGPFIPDTDEDGLLDGDEVHTYGTDPLNPDTDGDKLLDGEEGYNGLIFTKYGIYFDPLMSDTDSDGELDGDEIYGQTKQQQVQTHDGAITGISVQMNTNGNIDRNLSIENVYNIDMLSSNVVGLVGDPFEFKTTTNFDSATITFEIDQFKLNGTKLENLIVLWYNEENQRYVECSDQNGYITRIENSAISVTTTHFSQYMVVDKIAWYEAWEQSFQRFYYAAPSGSGQPNQVPIDHYNTVFVIDTSGSMSDDPNGGWLGYDPIIKKYTQSMPPISDPAMYEYWWKTYGYYSCKRITACENFIDTMYTNDKAAIITFSHFYTVQASLTSNKEELKNSLQKFSDGGGTHFSSAINKAVQLLVESGDTNKNNVVNRIVFLSDGEPENDTQSAINAAVDNAKTKGIKIYTVGLGIENTVLTNIAEETGGKSYKGIEASELPRIVSQATSPHSDGINPDFSSLVNIDSDDDNLPDLVEQFGLRPNGQKIATDENIPDSDGDGLLDGDEVKINKLEFIEGLKNGDCSRGIELLSDPLLEDGDKDGDMDSVDPHPNDYQLNDRFIYNTNLVYDLAVEYNKINPLNSEKYNGKPAEALVFMLIRYQKTHPKTGEKGWYCINSWPGVAGNLNLDFIDYVKQQNLNLYSYFENTEYIASAPNKYDIDLYHMAATISAYIYESDKVDGLQHRIIPEKHINALAGWAGDLQTLVYDSYVKVKDQKDPNNDDRYKNSLIVDQFIMDLGSENSRFGQQDINTDADAVNISNMILNQNYTLDNALTNYYKNGILSRFSSFINNGLNNSRNTAIIYINTQYLCVTWPIYDPTDDIWKNFLNTAIIPIEDSITITNIDAERMRDAFWDYLQGLASLEE